MVEPEPIVGEQEGAISESVSSGDAEEAFASFRRSITRESEIPMGTGGWKIWVGLGSLVLAFVFLFELLRPDEPPVVVIETVEVEVPASKETTKVVEESRSPSGNANMEGSGHKMERIAFLSNVHDPSNEEGFDIYVMNVENKETERITDGTDRIWSFSWSPDGSRIVYESYIEESLYVIRADGSDQRLLERDAHWPVWSPDGDWIVFYSDRDGDAEIFLINPDGSGLRQLTDNSIDDYSPGWSPGGEKIVFSSDGEISVMSSDGMGLQSLTEPPEGVWDSFPAYSPGGDQILFLSNRHSPGDSAVENIFLMDSDGSNIRQITAVSVVWPPVSWSPTGDSFLYTKGLFMHGDIYSMRLDGPEQRLNPGDEGVYFSPAWVP
jgi:TolB protein